jgi:hypothetical protein
MFENILKLLVDLGLLLLQRDTMTEEEFNQRARARIAEAEAVLGGIAKKQADRWAALREGSPR